jgi:hypothetical protein
MIFTPFTQRSQGLFFLLSLLFAALYAGLVIVPALSHEYAIQDDARQHIFWMQRYIDPALFPNDYIADYFQSVAPWGYRLLYRTLSIFGVAPNIASKIFPLFLSLTAAGYSYYLTVTFFPIPLAGFLSSLLLSQSLWYSHELASATPRGFLYPIFLAFLYYLARGQRRALLVCLLILVGFYPQMALVALGVLALRLVKWQSRPLKLSPKWQDYGFFLFSFVLVASSIFLSKLGTEAGHVVSRIEAMTMLEFQPSGRSEFFTSGFPYWLHGRSGLLHKRTFVPPTVLAGLALPFWRWLPGHGTRFKSLHPSIFVLVQLLVASLGLYVLAHGFLFSLHLPNRYTSHSLRIAISIAAGINWSVLLVSLWASDRSARGTLLPSSTPNSPPSRSASMPIARLGSGLIFLLLVLYPFLLLPGFPKVGYLNREVNRPLYEYLEAQPKDTLVAALSVEASDIPSLARRSVLVSSEHAIPYHLNYYRLFRERAIALITAQYTPDPDVVRAFINRYGVDLWLLDRAAFQADYLRRNKWIRQYQPAAEQAAQALAAGKIPLVQQAISTCTVFTTETLVLLDAQCVGQVGNPPALLSQP